MNEAWRGWGLRRETRPQRSYHPNGSCEARGQTRRLPASGWPRPASHGLHFLALGGCQHGIHRALRVALGVSTREEVLQGADHPAIYGILLTLADPYSITRDTLARIRKEFPDQLLRSVIPKNNDLQKAVGRACSVFEVAPASKGAAAYRGLIEELGL